MAVGESGDGSPQSKAAWPQDVACSVSSEVVVTPISLSQARHPQKVGKKALRKLARWVCLSALSGAVEVRQANPARP